LSAHHLTNVRFFKAQFVDKTLNLFNSSSWFYFYKKLIYSDLNFWTVCFSNFHFS
jgi:hypothetical protein